MTYLSNFCEKIFRIRRTFALLWLSEVAMPLLHGRVWEPGAGEVDDVNPGTRSNKTVSARHCFFFVCVAQQQFLLTDNVENNV